ncbi:MAG: inner membrane CreD family protein [Deltaproteobacteria bacterium]|nr:inner membrane CreD family protein [Candidatus Zymogenaceae bacterium]
MAKKIAALIFIFVCTSVAWMILGATVEYRTDEYGNRLYGEVEELYGSVQYQYAPIISYSYPEAVERTDPKTKKIFTETKTVNGRLPISGSAIFVDFNLDYRKKGLLWYSTYTVGFDGTYSIVNDTGHDVTMKIFHKFPATNTEYDDFHFYLGEDEMEKLTWRENGVETDVEAAAGETIVFRVVYRSRGQDQWFYCFGEDEIVEVKNFSLTANTDFVAVDYPTGSISPTTVSEDTDGMVMSWEYTRKISGKQIGVEMPKKINPGPLVGRITFFAPVSLLFFFFILFMITTLKEIRMHPMNYFFLACAFFAFHLLFAYLVDHLNVHLSFAISSVVSLFLVISYLRLVVGGRFAFLQAGVLQLVYLVLFSYTFFFKGYSALIVTIASIITLFVVMQMTGSIKWDEKFKALSKNGGSSGAISSPEK